MKNHQAGDRIPLKDVCVVVRAFVQAPIELITFTFVLPLNPLSFPIPVYAILVNQVNQSHSSTDSDSRSDSYYSSHHQPAPNAHDFPSLPRNHAYPHPVSWAACCHSTSFCAGVVCVCGGVVIADRHRLFCWKGRRRSLPLLLPKRCRRVRSRRGHEVGGLLRANRS